MNKSILRISLRAALLLALCALGAGFAAAAEPWWAQPKGPAYQVLVYSFADSNGDGYGDLNGLTARLDEIKSLGVSAIWLSPIHPSGSYHGYDVNDYLAIEKKLGTLEDFRLLIKEAHARDIKVLLDMVFNHTGAYHPWFKEFLKDPAGPKGNWYVQRRPGVSYGATSFGSWAKALRSDGNRVEYFATFWDQMPDLNLTNPEVIAALKEVLAYWLGEGVDGFRFDAAKEIFNTGKVPEGFPVIAKSREVWNSLRDAARAIKPDVFFIAEVNTTSTIEIRAYAQCFDSLFDFVTSKLINDLSASGNETGFVERYLTTLRMYQRVKGFVPAPFIANHDLERTATQILGRFGVPAILGYADRPDDVENLTTLRRAAYKRNRVEALLYLTMQGMPFIYYGEELGLTGRRYANDDLGRRDAMPWGNAPVRNALGLQGQTTTWQVKTGRIEPTQNSQTIPWDRQDAEPGSLLNLYRAIGALRQSQASLQGNSLNACDWPGANAASVVGFFRGEGPQRLVVLANLGDRAASVDLPAGLVWEQLFSTGTDVSVASGKLEIPAGTGLVAKAPVKP